MLIGFPIAGTGAKANEALTGKAAIVYATVEAIDRETRRVTFKGEEGSITFTAGPDVRNLDRIKKSDLVVFEYFEGLGISLSSGVEGVPARFNYYEPTETRGDTAFRRGV